MTAALNWYRAVPLRDRREFAGKVTVPTMHVWGEAESYFLEKGAQLCGDYVVGEYRFEVLKSVSHWIVDEVPDTVAEILLDWFGPHPAD